MNIIIIIVLLMAGAQNFLRYALRSRRANCYATQPVRRQIIIYTHIRNLKCPI